MSSQYSPATAYPGHPLRIASTPGGWATIVDGRIVAGNMACHQCGRPSAAHRRLDPFGKSDVMVPVCPDCLQASPSTPLGMLACIDMPPSKG